MKEDRATKETDRKLKNLEKKVRETYEQSLDEMTEKLVDFTEQFERDNKKYLKKLKNGEIDKKTYDRWLQSQANKRDHIQSMVDVLCEDTYNANAIAAQMIRGHMLDVYALNMNYAAFEIDTQIGFDTSYALYNHEAVKRLIKDDPALLPKVSVKKKKDKAWNRKKFRNEITQAILQGESIDNMAKRLERVMNMNYKQAVRNARTATTSAENGGRLNSYGRAEELGIDVTKMWMATVDGKTRHSHRLLDGQVQPLDKPFMSENGKIMFPGDPNADPSEIYNCFPGEIHVATNCEIERAYKHNYSGDIVSIKTASGIEFTCTPNHPILAIGGWVKAKSLNCGDDIAIAFVRNKKMTRTNPHVDHAFSRFDTLFQLIDVARRKWAGKLSVNFHGDVPTSDVEIITKKRFLRDNRNSAFRNLVNKFLFKYSDSSAVSKSALMKHLWSVFATTFGDVCGLCKSFSIFWTRLRHSEIHGLRPIAWGDSGRFKPINNSGSRNIENLCQCLNGFTGIVFSDKIVDVNINSFHGDVFNLQTENGYYFVKKSITDFDKKSNHSIGIIAHNCRCRIVGRTKYSKVDPLNLGKRFTRIPSGMTYDEWKAGKEVT